MARFKDETGNKYGKLTVICKSDKKTNGRIYWHCKCECGNECDVEGTKLRNGHTKSCGCAKTQANHNKAENLVGQRFGKLTVIQKLPSYNNQSQWLCECDCGNQKRVAGKHLRDGSITSCGCEGRSKGELKIAQLLSNNNISFTQEQSFDTCKFKDTNKLARFDFFVNGQYLIEFDGRQHFESCADWCTEEEVARTQARDDFKNNWCKENNIPLIRIPYTHLNEIQLDDLLLNTTKWRII